MLTFVELPLYIEQKKQDTINDFNQFCDRVGQQAQEQGLTEEKLAALLAHEWTTDSNWHEYFDYLKVDLKRVLGVIEHDLPPLKAAVQEMLETLDNS